MHQAKETDSGVYKVIVSNPYGSVSRTTIVKFNDPKINLTYKVSANSAAVTYCERSASGHLKIPSTFKGKPVTSIAMSAFAGCSSLTSVTIPNSVTSIGAISFQHCSSLTSVTIPDSVTSIGDWTFYGCISLTSVTIPDSVTSIGKSAFMLCSSLTSVTIPDSVTRIALGAFFGCSGLMSVTIPGSVTSIGQHAFGHCSRLTSVTFGGNAPDIGDEVFIRSSDDTKIFIHPGAIGFGKTFGGLPVIIDKKLPVIIQEKIKITLQPESQIVELGDSAEFVIGASGTGPLKYQWYKSGKQIAGATSSIYRIPKVSRGDFVNYSVMVKNVAGEVMSQVAELSRLIAPKITLQPQSQSVVLGDTTEFTIKASGTKPLEYQWYKSGKQIAGATSSIYRISKVSQGDFVIYSVRVKNVAGEAISQVAELSRLFAPKITLQPESQIVELGDSAEFVIGASGTGPLKYQWYKSGKQIAGATSSIYRIPKVSRGDFVNYSVMVKNVAGEVMSQVAELSRLIAPKITQQPQSQSVVFGSTAEFEVISSGSEPLEYQWYKDGQLIEGATEPIYRIVSVFQGDLGAYSVWAQNKLGRAYSQTVELRKPVSPKITQQPQSQSVVFGSTAEFEVISSGSEPLEYQWYKDGQLIEGATEPIYRIVSVFQGDLGAYSVWAQNKLGRAYSQTVELSLAQLHTLTVASRDPDSGITVTVSPADHNGQSDGTTQFTRVYYTGTEVSLSAMKYLGANQFKQWLANGEQVGTDPTVTVIMDYDRTLRAVYEPKPLTLTVASRDPDSGVTVTVSPVDQNGQAGGTTQFTRVYSKGTEVTLSATQNVGDNQFKQWLKNGAPAGTNPTVTVTMNEYDGTLRAVYMPKPVSPKITQQPQSQSVLLGSTAEFEVVSSGTEPLEYQWYKSGKQIVGATSSIYRIPKVSRSDFVNYSVMVKNVAGEVISQVAELSRLIAPKITQQPQSQSVVFGSTAEFEVISSGSEPLKYQWYKDGQLIEGATEPIYRIVSVFQGDLGAYSVWAQNKLGRAYSQTVELRKPVSPKITQQPQSQSVVFGSTAEFEVISSGSEPLEYQWYKDGQLIEGATEPIYRIVSVFQGDLGAYSVWAQNKLGRAYSQTVELSLAQLHTLDRGFPRPRQRHNRDGQSGGS